MASKRLPGVKVTAEEVVEQVDGESFYSDDAKGGHIEDAIRETVLDRIREVGTEVLSKRGLSDDEVDEVLDSEVGETWISTVNERIRFKGQTGYQLEVK